MLCKLDTVLTVINLSGFLSSCSPSSTSLSPADSLLILILWSAVRSPSLSPLPDLLEISELPPTPLLYSLSSISSLSSRSFASNSSCACKVRFDILLHFLPWLPSLTSFLPWLPSFYLSFLPLTVQLGFQLFYFFFTGSFCRSHCSVQRSDGSQDDFWYSGLSLFSYFILQWCYYCGAVWGT